MSEPSRTAQAQRISTRQSDLLTTEEALKDRRQAGPEHEAVVSPIQQYRRYIALALSLALLFLAIAGWQSYRLRRQRQVNERDRAQIQKMREADQLKDQFLANTSHELRTPLNGIIGIAEWLYGKRQALSPEELQNNLVLLIASGKRLNNLVQDIMDLSRLKNAQLQINPKSLNLHAITEAVLRINQLLIQGKDVQLVNTMPVDLPPVLADEGRLQQILHNLVGNAVKYTDRGTVTVHARVARQQVEISVTDTGIGIPPEEQQSIFQSFQQAGETVEPALDGMGLGLSITRQLVKLHGGEIWLESKPGMGSAFYFTLPLSDEQPEALEWEKERTASALFAFREGETPESAKAAASLNDHKVNILIVDDEPINQRVLSNHLDSGYYQITTAINGAEALKIIQSDQRFDLVLLDVMMPRMSGYEVCQKIRELYLPSELPVIMVTAKNLVRDLVTGLDTGANDYLAKPFSRDEFLARVKTQLNLHTINQATTRFVPAAFLHTLGRANITEVRLGDQAERQVTVFFSDIRGYTTLAESMTPEQNFKFVNALNRRMGPLIDSNRGFINQYLGDAIMAIFQESPADALRAAVAMQKALQRYNDSRVQKGRQRIRSGMGFHTGPLIMGIIGDDKRLEPATISDTVNTASRVESLTKHYGANILFSEDSLAGMPDLGEFHLRYLGQVQMKGKTQPVGIYECFDGDDPALFEGKRKTLDAFEKALRFYFHQQFAAAYQILNTVVQTNPRDETAKLFLRRAVHFMEQGAPSDWTGVEEMGVK